MRNLLLPLLQKSDVEVNGRYTKNFDECDFLWNGITTQKNKAGLNNLLQIMIEESNIVQSRSSASWTLTRKCRLADIGETNSSRIK